VNVVTGEPVDPSHQVPGVSFHVVPMRRAIAPGGDLIAVARFRMLLLRLKPDVVWAATPKASLIGLLAARLTGTPHRIFHMWGCRWDRGRGAKAWLLRQADRVACACSTDVIPVSRSLGGLLREHRITMRPIVPIGEGGTKGVDLDSFRPRASARPAGDPPVIGFLGRLSRDKGIGWLPEVLARVRKEIPKVRCLVVGGEDRDDPPDSAALAALRGDPAVEMLGAVSDVPAAIRRMDVLCFPSLREGLPNAVIEAAACGIPTVGWDATGTRDATRDGETGFLVGPGDSARMASRLVELLTSPELRTRMGHAARALVARHWDARIVERGMLRRLEELLPPRTAP
jgi:glycosyltransferase involved in cell wall biosynthesis